MSATPRRILAVNGMLPRHGLAHRHGDGVQQFGFIEQRRPPRWRFTVGAGQPKFRSTPAGLEAYQLGRIVGHARRIGPEQLHPHRRPLDVALPLRSSGEQPEGPRRQHGAGNPDELGHRMVVALDAGQHLAENVVREAFHRSEG